MCVHNSEYKEANTTTNKPCVAQCAKIDWSSTQEHEQYKYQRNNQTSNLHNPCELSCTDKSTTRDVVNNMYNISDFILKASERYVLRKQIHQLIIAQDLRHGGVIQHIFLKIVRLYGTTFGYHVANQEQVMSTTRTNSPIHL